MASAKIVSTKFRKITTPRKFGAIQYCFVVFQAEYDKLIPVQKIRTALEEAERLSSHLRERYSQPQGKRPKLDSESPQGGGVADQQVPNDTNSGNNKPLSAEDLYKRNSVRAHSHLQGYI